MWGLVLFAATGSPPPSFQWFKNGKKVKDAVGPELFVEVTESAVGEYSVDVYNDSGTVNSAIARVKLDERAPVITQHPVEVFAAFGEPVVLSVKGTYTHVHTSTHAHIHTYTQTYTPTEHIHPHTRTHLSTSTRSHVIELFNLSVVATLHICF